MLRRRHDDRRASSHSKAHSILTKSEDAGEGSPQAAPAKIVVRPPDLSGAAEVGPGSRAETALTYQAVFKPMDPARCPRCGRENGHHHNLHGLAMAANGIAWRPGRRGRCHAQRARCLDAAALLAARSSWPAPISKPTTATTTRSVTRLPWGCWPIGCRRSHPTAGRAAGLARPSPPKNRDWACPPPAGRVSSCCVRWLARPTRPRTSAATRARPETPSCCPPAWALHSTPPAAPTPTAARPSCRP